MRKPDLELVRATLRRYDYPVAVVIELTAYCNLRCIMCPQDRLTRRRGYMSFETFRRIADDVALHSPESDMWLAIMGESLLLGEELYRFLDYAHSKGLMNVSLNTNLLPLEESDCERLLLAELKSIIVGIDAATPETYSRVRVGGDFARVQANMLALLAAAKRLKLKRPRIVAQFIVMEENRHEEKAFVEFWTAHGSFVKVRQKLGWGAGVEAANLTIPQAERSMPCPWLLRTVSIHWDGRLTQCDALWNGERYFGDVNKSSIKEIWDGELAGRRDRHWQGDFDFEPCRECRDWQCGLSTWYEPKDENG